MTMIFRRIVAAGVVGASVLAGAQSAVATAVPVVTIALGSASIYEYTPTTVSGTVSQSSPHHVVFLQSRKGTGWGSIAQQALDANGHYAFTVTPGTVETLTMRVYDPPTANGIPAAVSQSVVLQTRLVNVDDMSDTLPAGHSLVAYSGHLFPQLVSAHGRTMLDLYGSGQLTFENHVEVGGVGYGYDLKTINSDTNQPASSTLTMQPDGNLVWRDDRGRVLFQSGTTGAGNYARLVDSGELLVRTPAGHTLWSSGTTNVIMIANDELLSGRYLVNRSYVGQTTWLKMQTNGDLTLFYNNTQVWHTGTSVAGSHLTITTSGRAAVVTPAGHLAWQSPSVGTNPLFRVAESGRLTLMNFPRENQCWEIPAGVLTCDEG